MIRLAMTAVILATAFCATPRAAEIRFDPAKVASMAADKFTPAPSVGVTGGAAPVILAAVGTHAIPTPATARSYAVLPIVGLMGAMLVACVIAFTAARASSRAIAN